jgi:nitrite reductase (cytochrome c-552)
MNETRKSSAGLYWFVAVLAAGATFGIASMKSNISDRKAEAKQTSFTLVDIDEKTSSPAIWGQNFPRQYDSYRRTVDQDHTKYGGSEAFQKLDEDPQWKLIFAGYAFAIDYREERGHAYMLSDQRETERVHKKAQPGACIHCHASAVAEYRAIGIKAGAPGDAGEPLLSDHGKAQLNKGFEEVCKMPYSEATKNFEHPVACIDCHDPKSMQLRITRPGFLTGISEFAKSKDPAPHLPSIERWREGGRDKPYDPNIDATRQELRSMVCGQCHVEYYFKGEGKVVTYPWHNGFKAEQMEAYYDAAGFKDWSHGITGAPVLKAQHPEFELWSQGIHARSGVSCADCHMPYVREGAVKISSHHVRSPLLNMSQACLTCHNYPESEMKARVEAIQDRTRNLMDRAENAVVALIAALDSAKGHGATDEELTPARNLQRKAQWRLDFIAAENSMGFHAPQESARILGEAIDYARQGELEVLKALQK